MSKYHIPNPLRGKIPVEINCVYIFLILEPKHFTERGNMADMRKGGESGLPCFTYILTRWAREKCTFFIQYS